MNSAFVDTSYLLALELANDRNHRAAARHWQRVIPALPPLVTTSYVFDEVVTFFNGRGHHAKAVQVGETLLYSPSVRLVQVDESLFYEGWVYFRRHHDKTYLLAHGLRLFCRHAEPQHRHSLRLRQALRSGRLRHGALRKMLRRSASRGLGSIRPPPQTARSCPNLHGPRTFLPDGLSGAGGGGARCVRGLTTRRIAEELMLSEHTVGTHVHNTGRVEVSWSCTGVSPGGG